MRAVAEVHERRHKRQQQQQHDQRRRSAAQQSSTSTARVRRPQQSVTIGEGDYLIAEVPDEQQQQEGGEYSAERLAALRLNAIHIGPTSSTSSSSTDRIESVVDDDNDDSNAMTDREQRLVRAAKAQRARQRAMTELGEDYIPIASRHKPPPADDDVIRIDDDTNEYVSAATARVGRTYLTAEQEDDSEHGTLMREEDEDDVVDMTMEAREVKEQDRLLFGDDGKQKRRDKTRQEITDTLKWSTERDEVEVEDVDSEMEEWEAEQLRNGGVRLAEKMTASTQRPTSSMAQSRDRDIDTATPQISLASLSLSSLQSSLQSSLSTLHHTNTAAQSSLAALATRLASSRTTLSTLTASLDELNDRYQFYQQERDWVSVWSGMMAEKVADIDEAWQEMTNMRRKHGEERQARMRQYRRDEREETGLLAKSADGGVELDEFGRDVGYAREMDRERRDKIRSEVRQLLQQRRQSRDAGSKTSDNDDELYDEVEGIAAVQKASRVSFEEDVRGIMADVDDEWRSASRIITHFQHWRRTDQQSYHSAYVSLTLPKMLAPYVRIDLMLHSLGRPEGRSNWPLFGSSTIHSLLHAPLTAGENEEEPVAVQLIAELVVPWLCEVLRWECDMHNRRLVSLLADTQNTFMFSLNKSHRERFSQQWQRVYEVVAERLRAEVDEWQPLVMTDGRKVNELQFRAIVRECVRGGKLLAVLGEWLSNPRLWLQLDALARPTISTRLEEATALLQSHVLADFETLSKQMLLRGTHDEAVNRIEPPMSWRDLRSKLMLGTVEELELLLSEVQLMRVM